VKNLIFGAALLICGMIGITSVIICCGLAVTGSRQAGIGIFFGNSPTDINLTMPLIIFIILLISGFIFSIAGFRNKK